MENDLRKHRLRIYRSVQTATAVERDRGLCIFCYFLDDNREPVDKPPHRITKRADVHHVYGRGRATGDWQEHYTNLACTCRSCHPLPIKDPGGNGSLAWVETALKMANEAPINRRFSHRP